MSCRHASSLHDSVMPDFVCVSCKVEALEAQDERLRALIREARPFMGSIQDVAFGEWCDRADEALEVKP